MDHLTLALIKIQAGIMVIGALLVEATDLTSLPSLLGYGVLGPAMFWAYRTNSKTNTDSKDEAWAMTGRLREELERSREENKRRREENEQLHARIAELISGSTKEKEREDD